MPELAVIGGTGVYEAGFLSGVKPHALVTPYGTVEVQIGRHEGTGGGGAEVVFLTRHGIGHSVPPHRINYRANIWALRALGVKRIFATGAVGSLQERMAPGDCVLVSDFLDFARERPATFFEGQGAGGGSGFGVVHTDVSEPYCPELRRVLRQASEATGVAVHDGGCYVSTSGPRFETPAEIRMFRRLGADVVGMTNVPEVVLARELGMCYGLVAMVTNYAAGMTGNPLTHAEVVETMAENVRKIRALVWRALGLLPAERSCLCGRNLIVVGEPPAAASAGEGPDAPDGSVRENRKQVE
ncbi:MAG: S-methyl-5'-thioadenosine phosphorylase [Bacillota bacterium]|nr:S-methyl-5'-thioadenosine phosphorylase [Bacillota bacterium]